MQYKIVHYLFEPNFLLNENEFIKRIKILKLFGLIELLWSGASYSVHLASSLQRPFLHLISQKTEIKPKNQIFIHVKD